MQMFSQLICKIVRKTEIVAEQEGEIFTAFRYNHGKNLRGRFRRGVETPMRKEQELARERNKRSIMPRWTRSQLCMLTRRISTQAMPLERTYGYRGLFRSLVRSLRSPHES